MSGRAVAASLVLVMVLASCGADDEGALPADDATTMPPSTAGTVAVTRMGNPTELVGDLELPWGVAFLPSGQALIGQRDTATITVVNADGSEARAPIDVPDVVPGGEGGLLGLAVSPTYDSDQWVYAYLTTADDNRIVRFKLADDAVIETQVVTSRLTKANIHNGGRIAFGPDGNLYAGVGDAGQRGLSQDLGSNNGKILRMTPDGQPVDGNLSGLVLSMGHRNVQGLAWDEAGRLWASEFGQNTTDELNLIEAGNNYGWPEVEGNGDTNGGEFTNPAVTWSTDQASPSGIAIVDEGDGQAIYVGALRGERLWRVALDGNGGVGEPEARLRGEFGRLRTPAKAPDGSLWVATSNGDDDRVIRLSAQPA